MKRLENKIALVTGGARGMGTTHVKGFIAEGAKVYFTDLSEEEGKLLEAEVGSSGVFIKQDVSSEDDWRTVMETIERTEGRLDVLVNNAGIAVFGLIGEMSLEQYMKIININQVSVFLGMTHALPLMLKSTAGSIVNISSLAGMRGERKGSVAYGSSKYAVRGLTQAAALDLAPYKIRVNSVHPGAINTPILRSAPEEARKELLEKVPLKRAAEPEEVTNLVLFLASDESSYITAGEFVIDGGVLTQ